MRLIKCSELDADDRIHTVRACIMRMRAQNMDAKRARNDPETEVKRYCLVMYSNPIAGDEILFPSMRDHDHGMSTLGQDCWGTPSEGLPYLKEFVKTFRVPFLRLAHITHDREARQIVNETTKFCEYKVKQKLGRFSGRSFKWDNSQFVMVDSNTPLLDGYFSWWSPYTHDYKEEFRHFLSAVELRRQILESFQFPLYFANYLKDPPESFYGNHVFHCDFKYLLNAYAASRFNSHICIKFGGILRYKYEMCHVLIICVPEDELYFPPINEIMNHGVFYTNGLTDHAGIVINKDAVADFLPRNIVTWVAGKSYSYATAAVGFYYPNQYGLLKVEPNNWKRGLIGHQSAFCAKKVMKCPN